ncbi:unnamed protein product [Lactuca saligna]|uniref:DUF4216 domain-containing protein n=1 Tax=Lactuca saligna TaxID=75948 RepID=A0AA35V934_LACSI|nr:unnamed protein product [Lactuca saligna]
MSCLILLQTFLVISHGRLSIKHFQSSISKIIQKSGQQRPLTDDEMRIAHNYILINCVGALPFLRLRNEDPFILASQAKQVYYAPYPAMKDLKGWWVVVKTKPRDVYDLRQCVTEEDDDEDEEDQFFQESKATLPSTSSIANEVAGPFSHVIEG